MSSPTVTVIIVFLNEEAYLLKAIESVFDQTWHDWELLLVDDGSTDESTNIARELAGRDAGRVKYLEHPGHVNRGMSAARNLGINHARGRYIAFLDADDLWTPAKLEHQVAVLEQYPEVAMAFGRLEYFTTEPDIAIPKGVPPLRVPQGVLRPPIVFEQSLIGPGRMLWTTGLILFRKQSLLEVKSFEESFRGLGEDVAVWSKVALGYSVYAMDECVLHYRRHRRASGIQDQRAGLLTTGWVRVMKWLYQYVQQQPLTVQRWAVPIVHEALFQSFIEDTHSLVTTPSISLVKRGVRLTQMWAKILRCYPELITKRHLRQIINLAVSEVRAILRVRTRLRKLWHAL